MLDRWLVLISRRSSLFRPGPAACDARLIEIFVIDSFLLCNGNSFSNVARHPRFSVRFRSWKPSTNRSQRITSIRRATSTADPYKSASIGPSRYGFSSRCEESICPCARDSPSCKILPLHFSKQPEERQRSTCSLNVNTRERDASVCRTSSLTFVSGELTLNIKQLRIIALAPETLCRRDVLWKESVISAVT